MFCCSSPPPDGIERRVVGAQHARLGERGQGGRSRSCCRASSPGLTASGSTRMLRGMPVARMVRPGHAGVQRAHRRLERVAAAGDLRRCGRRSASAYERTTASLSASWPSCGNVPPNVMPGRLVDTSPVMLRNSTGAVIFGSNSSMCDGPPCRNSSTTDLSVSRRGDDAAARAANNAGRPSARTKAQARRSAAARGAQTLTVSIRSRIQDRKHGVSLNRTVVRSLEALREYSSQHASRTIDLSRGSSGCSRTCCGSMILSLPARDHREDEACHSSQPE